MWKRRRKDSSLLTVLIILLGFLVSSEGAEITRSDKRLTEVPIPVARRSTEAAASAAASNGLLSPQLRVILGALENVDDMLRTTIPSIDKFQCLERLMCSMVSSDPTAVDSTDGTSILEQALQLPFDPTFQQGIIQNSQAIQQGFPQDPSFQQGLLQNPVFQSANPQDPAFQQAFAQNPALFQQGFIQNPAFQGPQGGFQTFQPGLGGTGFQNSFPNFRENTESRSAIRRNRRPPVQRRRRPSRRTFLDSIRDVFKGFGKRKKRNAITDALSAFTTNRFLGILDQMMSQYSFYPYTHAAYMGYTGSPRRCETLYPSCPSSPEEMIDVFNNIHRHYPGGIPFKDKMPWPLNVLLP